MKELYVIVGGVPEAGKKPTRKTTRLRDYLVMTKLARMKPREKYFFLIGTSIVLLSSMRAMAQSTRYELGFTPGVEHTLAARGPKHKTEVSEVVFKKPISKSIGGMFDIKSLRRGFYGIEYFYDEFDYGYFVKPSSLIPGAYRTDGNLTAADRVALNKVGIRLGYMLVHSNKVSVNSIIIPSAGYYRYSEILNDTANSWSSPMTPLKEALCISYPPFQNSGIYFLLKGTLELQYQWSRKIATSVMFSYQQGFTPFVIDTVNVIRPFEPGGLKQHKYWTSVNGTALQWHFGLKYTFSNKLRRHDD